jgi:hypothetical protein
MAYTISHFMGYHFDLFNYATKTVSDSTNFYYFQIQDKGKKIMISRAFSYFDLSKQTYFAVES